MKNLLKILLIILTTIILLVIALEIYYRKTESYITKQTENRIQALDMIKHDPTMLRKDTPKGKRLIPNSHVIINHHYGSGRNIKIDINSNGFRDDELTTVKPDNEIRILFLGDSIVLGDFVNKEETFVEIAQTYLNNLTKNKKIEIINSGVTDIGIKEEIDILMEQGLSINPDYVILGFYLNDSRPPWGFPDELGSRGWIRQHSVFAETIYKKMKLQKWIKEKGFDRTSWYEDGFKSLNWMNDNAEFKKWADLAKMDWGAAWDDQSWVIVDRELDRLKALSEKHGFKVAVICFPVTYQVYSNILENSPQKTIEQKSAILNFKFLDLLPVLRNNKHGSRLFFDHCHPTERAHQIIGKEIADFIRTELLSNG